MEVNMFNSAGYLGYFGHLPRSQRVAPYHIYIKHADENVFLVNPTKPGFVSSGMVLGNITFGGDKQEKHSIHFWEKYTN